MDFVLDASVACSWLLNDEFSEYSESVISSLPSKSAVSPALWSLEITNTLCVVSRRGRISNRDFSLAIDQINLLQISEEPYSQSRVLEYVTPLAKKHQLSTYDAAYLELAMRRGLPLASLDKALVEAAKKEGVDGYQPTP